MKIGLYFGTFNPIHVGHLIIANYFAEHTDLNQVWMVVTPHNPLKNKDTLLKDSTRLELVFLATEDYPKIKPCDIEFQLPQPNYTVNTLAHLQDKYPKNEFSLIMGEDNLKSFHKWKNYERILEQCDLLVYPRPNCEKTPFHQHPKVKITAAPQVEISSTFIRNAIKENKNVQYFVPEKVWKYMMDMGYYK
jgi:nicotinate-nucleotide adenylyltransferase